MSIVEDYRSGSEVTPEELNKFQDVYIDSGFTPWFTFGGMKYNTGSGVQYHGPGSVSSPPGLIHVTLASRPAATTRIDPSDYPMSYNGSLRSLQWRLVVAVITGVEAPPASAFSGGVDISLRSVSVVGTSSPNPAHSFGSKLGAIVYGPVTHTKGIRYWEGNPFTISSAGNYTIETQLGATGITANQTYAITALLQMRGI